MYLLMLNWYMAMVLLLLVCTQRLSLLTIASKHLLLVRTLE